MYALVVVVSTFVTCHYHDSLGQIFALIAHPEVGANWLRAVPLFWLAAHWLPRPVVVP